MLLLIVAACNPDESLILPALTTDKAISQTTVVVKGSVTSDGNKNYIQWIGSGRKSIARFTAYTPTLQPICMLVEDILEMSNNLAATTRKHEKSASS